MLKYFEELVPRHTKCERFVKKFAIQRRADAIIPNCNSRTLRSMVNTVKSRAEIQQK